MKHVRQLGALSLSLIACLALVPAAQAQEVEASPGCGSDLFTATRAESVDAPMTPQLQAILAASSTSTSGPGFGPVATNMQDCGGCYVCVYYCEPWCCMWDCC